MKFKKLFISLTAVFSVILCLGVFLLVWFACDTYPDFKGFRKEFVIPGLKDGAVPQGLGTCNAEYEYAEGGATAKDKQQYYFVSAYMVDGSPSRIYVTGEKTGDIGYFTLKDGGNDVTDHCGGVASNGTFVWVASEGYVYCLKFEDAVSAAKNNSALDIPAKFNANCNADFCYLGTDGSSTTNYFYVGEFYREGDYETDKSHHFTTPVDSKTGLGGAENKAVMYRYNVSSYTDFGLTATTVGGVSVPQIQRAYSIPDKVQGVAFTQSGLVLSQSWGLTNSTLGLYSTSTINGNYTSNGFKAADGQRCTLYYVDEYSLANEYSLPAMTEGLCTVNSRVYVLSESAGAKYKMFVRERVKNVYSFVPHVK